MNRRVLAASFLRTTMLRRRLRTRDQLEPWQAARLKDLIAHASSATRFYAPFRGRSLADLPIVDKAATLRDFAAFNTLGLNASAAWDVIEGRARWPGFEIGPSTGTTGLRGLYVISDAERFRWLGSILAKALPDVVWRRHRVAVLLPGPSPLYQSANQSRMLRLLALDPRNGPESLLAPLEAFAPTVIVAAPKTLRFLAEHGLAVRPARLYAAAEIMDPPDRAIITRHFGVAPGQIYMATEGLLGVSCPLGTLHLAEDAMHFELEPIGGDPTLVTPIVTDFVRRTQILARYRINDLLRLAPRRCPCGSPYRSVTVVGRREDMIALRARNGLKPVAFSPDILRDTVLAADPAIDDFRIHRLNEHEVMLILPLDLSLDAADRARAALENACQAAGADAAVLMARQALSPPFAYKLRRVTARPPDPA